MRAGLPVAELASAATAAAAASPGVGLLPLADAFAPLLPLLEVGVSVPSRPRKV